MCKIPGHNNSSINDRTALKPLHKLRNIYTCPMYLLVKLENILDKQLTEISIVQHFAHRFTFQRCRSVTKNCSTERGH